MKKNDKKPTNTETNNLGHKQKPTNAQNDDEVVHKDQIIYDDYKSAANSQVARNIDLQDYIKRTDAAEEALADMKKKDKRRFSYFIYIFIVIIAIRYFYTEVKTAKYVS